MRRQICTEHRYLQCLFRKFFDRNCYGDACRIISRFVYLLQLDRFGHRFIAFLYLREYGFCLIQRVEYHITGIYADTGRRDCDISGHMKARVRLYRSVKNDRYIFLNAFAVGRFDKLRFEPH